MSNRNRDWCFTINNYTEEDIASLSELVCKYIVYGKEVGESGTPHLQGYVSFKDQKTLSACKKLVSYRAHAEARLGTQEQAAQYCKKAGDFLERGVLPMSQVDKGQSEKDRWSRIIKKIESNDMAWLKENEPRFYTEGDRSIQSVRKRARLAPVARETLDNYWIYGPTGTGKSRKVFEEHPGAYRKDPKERWWDGYDGQEVVIIDDFDVYQKAQGGDIKRWCDHYPFMAPVKGGYIEIRPKTIIITSNYSIDEIWDDAQTAEPMKRRCKVIKCEGPAANWPIFGENPVQGFNKIPTWDVPNK